MQFRFSESNLWIWVPLFSLLISICTIPVFIIASYMNTEETLTVILIVAVFIIALAVSYYATNYYAMGEAEWTFDNKGVYKKWLQNIRLKNRKDEYFLWNDIVDLSISRERYYYHMAIKLRDGRLLKSSHDRSSIGVNEFDKFYETFEREYKKNFNAKDLLK